jgi:hypothetical protein
MDDQHPITPPPELVASLRNSAPHGIGDAGVTRELWLINHAYAAGADQELEACLERILDVALADQLHAARRPPSLKEQALKALHTSVDLDEFPEQYNTIRRALEQLDD